MSLTFLPVMGSPQERFVLELAIAPGEPGQLYCTRSGEHFIRKNSAVYMLKGHALMSYVEKRLRRAQGCPQHGEQIRYACACASPAELVCALCLLEGSHQGPEHVYRKIEIE